MKTAPSTAALTPREQAATSPVAGAFGARPSGRRDVREQRERWIIRVPLLHPTLLRPERRAPHAPAARACDAFTLIELLVVIGIIGILASLLTPALSRAKENGRVAKCLGNLHQIGIGLQLYVGDNENRMPLMRDATYGTNAVASTNAPLPSPDVVLARNLSGTNVWQCPSDRDSIFTQSGSSYGWNSLLNGQDADHLKVFLLDPGQHNIPVFYDKESFHKAIGVDKDINFLYADGHIRNLLELGGTR